MKYKKMLTAAVIIALAAVYTPVAQENYSQILMNFNEGMKYYKAGDYEQAVLHFKALTDLSPDYADAYYMIGLCRMNQKKYDAALESFNAAVDKGKNTFDVFANIVNIHIGKKQFDKALVEIRKINADKLDERKKYSFYSLRGRIYYSNKMFDKAIDDLKTATSLKKSARYLKMLAESYYYEGYYEDAAGTFDAALSEKPGDTKMLELAARSYINLAKQTSAKSRKNSYYDKALDYSGKLASGNPSDFDALNIHGQALLGAERYTEAEKYFKKALEIKPNRCHTVFNLGQAYQGQEEWTSAVNNYSKATKCLPKDPVVWKFTGWAYENLKNLEEARKAYQKAASLKGAGMTEDLDRIAKKIKNLEIEQENITIEQEKKEAAALRKRVMEAIKLTELDMQQEGKFIYVFGNAANNSEKDPVEVTIQIQLLDGGNNVLKSTVVTKTIVKGDSRPFEYSVPQSDISGEVANYSVSLKNVKY